MVEWPSSGYVRTFDQSAANGRKEPTLPMLHKTQTAAFSRDCSLNDAT